MRRFSILPFAALAVSLLSCKGEVPGSKDKVKETQSKVDAARPPTAAKRQREDPNGTLVAIVLHKKWTAEGRLERYVRLKKGDLLRLRPLNHQPEFLYRYRAGRVIKPTLAGRYFKVNGKIVGALVSGESYPVDVKALYNARKQIRTLHWLNDRLDPKTVDAILQLASNDLTLIYGGSYLPKNGLQQLKRIAHKVSVLQLRYASSCEPRRSNELDQQMLKVMRVFAGAKEVHVKPYGYFTYSLRKMPTIPNLRGLDTEHAYVDDEHLKLIGRISGLQRLDLGRAAITDAGLVEIARLKQLRYLNLWQTRVSDTGLRHLAKLLQMRELGLAYTGVAGLGLKHIAKMRHLKSLVLNGTQVTGPELRHLAKLKRLQSLHLNSTRITGDELAHLTKLRLLHTLTISKTKVSDAHTSSLSKLLPLRHLDIEHTSISDASVQRMSKLKNLRILLMHKTKITRAGYSKLLSHHRDCIVHIDRAW